MRIISSNDPFDLILGPAGLLCHLSLDRIQPCISSCTWQTGRVHPKPSMVMFLSRTAWKHICGGKKWLVLAISAYHHHWQAEDLWNLWSKQGAWLTVDWKGTHTDANWPGPANLSTIGYPNKQTNVKTPKTRMNNHSSSTTDGFVLKVWVPKGSNNSAKHNDNDGGKMYKKSQCN